MRNKMMTTVVVATLALLALADAASAYYSPRLGRFLSRDPINEPGAAVVRQATRSVTSFIPRDPIKKQEGLNQVSFVFNRPLCGIDPIGLQGASFMQPIALPEPSPIPMPIPMPPAFPKPPRSSCCNGQKYDPDSSCCDDGKVVEKVSIWMCSRVIDTWYGPILWLASVRHCYVCCDGDNQNCYSKGPHNTEPGKIDHEGQTSGTCWEKKVCPRFRKSKCENPTTDSAYDWKNANCCDWAYKGWYDDN
jgi:hypothetical protein